MFKLFSSLALLAAFGASAHAETSNVYNAWTDPAMRSRIGVGITAGGGITGFTDVAMRDVMRNDLGGLWDVRASIGTHIPIGLDISYLGSAAKLEAFGEDNGTLIGTTFEAAVRFNLAMRDGWNPYVFGGAGWQRYDVRNPRFTSAESGILDRDDTLEFPLGVALSIRDTSGLVVSVRTTYRFVTGNDLVLQDTGAAAELHTWELSAAVGYEL